jgi:mitochondrial inner membrane protease subunit 2
MSLLGIVLALILPPTMVFRNHFYDIIRVTGPSMSPYLNTDFEDGSGAATDVHDITKSTDRILLNLYEPRKNLRRGMVVAFRTPHDPEKWAIKRVVALQGDRVFPLVHYPGFEALEGRGLVIPFGHMWVEGDVSDSNKKDASMDSNIYGPISTGLVMGKATHVITSFFSKWISIDSTHFKLPARVQTDAFALSNPDQEYQAQKLAETFHNGQAAEILKALKKRLQDQRTVERCRNDPDMVQMLHVIGDGAYIQREKAENDALTSELASSLLATVIQLLGEKKRAPSPQDLGKWK